MDLARKKILVTGSRGFLGGHLVSALRKRGVPEENLYLPSREEADLRSAEVCDRAVAGRDLVIHLAGVVGGIGFNQANPASLFYDNIVMGTHLLESARLAGVGKFVTLGTICAYPKFTPVPFKEDDLWKGYPEETNAPYGLAKKMLLVQAQAYRAQYGMNAITLFPVNLYGPGDNFDPESGHVIPALIRKIAAAKQAGHAPIEVWGTGTPTREFLYAEDAAEGILLAAEKYDKPEPVNLGSGAEISVRDLVHLIADKMGYKGEVRWNKDRPDGQPRRRLDVSRAKREFGFEARTTFDEGLEKTIKWFEEHNPQYNNG